MDTLSWDKVTCAAARGSMAIQKVDELLHEGYTDIVDAELSKYFDTIPHSELLQCVARRIVDRHMLHLIKRWLKVPVEERDDDGKRRLTGGKDNDRGTPLTRGEEHSRPCHGIRTPMLLRFGPVV